MNDPAAPLQYASVPELRVAGQARAELARDLAWLRVDEDIDGMKRLRAVLIATGPRVGERVEGLNWLDGRVLDFGGELAVAMGPEASRALVFSGRVSALELHLAQGRAPEVECHAEDRLMELRMTRRFKTYENVSDADLVRAIAAEHGLSAEVDLDGPTHALAQQWNQSDLAFLRERARRLAAEIWIEGDRLCVAARERRARNRLTLVQGGTLHSARFSADLAHQRASVHVGGYDEVGKRAIDEQVGADAVNAEARGNRHGVEVLRAALGDERASHRVRDVPLDDAQAAALARAALLTRARRFVTVSGVAEGAPTLNVGSELTLERVGGLFEGEGYHVTRVGHQFDLTHGYRTHFEAERAWIGRGA